MRKLVALTAVLFAVSAAELFGTGNVTVTINDHLPCSGKFYTGMTNYVNIHIENDSTIVGMTLGFEISGYAGVLDWVELSAGCGGSCYVEEACRTVGIWNLGGFFEQKYGFDGVLPDTIGFGGASFGLGFGLPPGDLSDIVYRIAVDIPAGAPAGQICIDNIFVPPSYAWTFDFGIGGFPPLYNGCTNTSVGNPDCPAICFPVEQRTCGDFDGNGMVSIADYGPMLQIIMGNLPMICPPKFADVNGDCQFDAADTSYMRNFLFSAGPAPDCSCDPAVAACIPPVNLCTNSTSDAVVMICPGGDEPFKVYLKDQNGDPVVGDSSVYLVFNNCSGIITCPPSGPISTVYPIAPSNLYGELTFFVEGGGCNNACEAEVTAACGVITTVPVRSFDINGDLGVSLGFDFDFSECNNYNAVPGIQYYDQNAFFDHVDHYCGLSPCDRFQAEFFLEPDFNLTPGDVVALKLVLKNNNFDACQIGFIGFFSSGFGSGGGSQLIQNYNYNQSLPPGTIDTVSIPYTVPGVGHGCLDVQFVTSCCSTQVELTQCAQSTWHCTGDAGLCYEVFIRLDGDDVDDIVFFENLPPGGWSVNQIHVPSTPLSSPDSIIYQICTPPIGELGDEAIVVVAVDYATEPTDFFENRVFITSRTGDADGNCIVNISDAVYLINYIFAGGPAPIPLASGDVDCSGFVSISDAVLLINFIFAGGPPPCIP